MRLALALLLCLATLPAAAAPCTGRGVEVQVLGSGGPETAARRAGSSYLLWVEGHARVLVDAGGGSFLRFGEAGARMADLHAVLFTHLHADHTADFPALLKSSFFEDRERPLPVWGPAGNDLFPATTDFVRALFDPERGAFRYLGDHLTPGSGAYPLEAHDLAPEAGQVRRAFEADGIGASAVAVSHGPVPALAWRLDVAGRSVAFSGDTAGDDGSLEKLARGVDLLVTHNAVPEGATGTARRLHMPPSVIGRIAADAAVGRLLLSHRMGRTLGREAETLGAVAAAYRGPVDFAEDLDCLALRSRPMAR